MSEFNIPKSEYDNVMGSFWIMLRTCESNADNDNDALLKHQVGCFFKQWNMLTGQDHIPIWERRKKDLEKSEKPV